MKKLNKFLDEASMWKVYIFGFIIMSIMCFIVWHFMGYLIHDELLTVLINLKISVSLGAVFGLMFMLMISMGRKSKQFWDKSKILEDKINEAKTKGDLQKIFDNEFKELKGMSMGGPHHTELSKLYAIINTKHKYIQA